MQLRLEELYHEVVTDLAGFTEFAARERSCKPDTNLFVAIGRDSVGKRTATCPHLRHLPTMGGDHATECQDGTVRAWLVASNETSHGHSRGQRLVACSLDL
jgi:hypothetical protein